MVGGIGVGGVAFHATPAFPIPPPPSSSSPFSPPPPPPHPFPLFLLLVFPLPSLLLALLSLLPLLLLLSILPPFSFSCYPSSSLPFLSFLPPPPPSSLPPIPPHPPAPSFSFLPLPPPCPPTFPKNLLQSERVRSTLFRLIFSIRNYSVRLKAEQIDPRHFSCFGPNGTSDVTPQSDLFRCCCFDAGPKRSESFSGFGTKWSRNSLIRFCVPNIGPKQSDDEFRTNSVHRLPCFSIEWARALLRPSSNHSVTYKRTSGTFLSVSNDMHYSYDVFGFFLLFS